MALEQAYKILYGCTLTGFSVLILIMLIRAVIGPRITDRVLSINMIGTMVICCIVICSQLLGESYLIDVALIYALVSFVSVLIFARIYIPLKPEREAFGEGAFNEIHTGHENEEQAAADNKAVHTEENAKERKDRKGRKK